MSPNSVIAARTVVMPVDNIDTDQIIPARFLTTTTRHGLGKHLFSAWRFDDNGAPRDDFILNEPSAANCTVLVAGRNFGCGSSREHAPWALMDFGFRAVISTEIADIFRSNALKNGLIPVVVDDTTHQWLIANPGTQVEIDIAAATLRLPDGQRCVFPIDEFSQHCLVNGLDELGYLLSLDAQVSRFEAEHNL